MIKVKLDQGAYMPTRAHLTDAGYDLYAKEDAFVPACNTWTSINEGKKEINVCVGSAIIDTGVHIQLPKNTAGLLVSKSGLNVKYDITSTGLIDEGYTGSIIVKLYNHNERPYVVHKGDKISQLVIINIQTPAIEVVDELDERDRGDNGFGSSGR